MSADWPVVHPKQIFSERRHRANDSDTHLTPSQSHGVLPQTEYMKATGNRVVLNLTGQDNMKRVEANDFIIHLRSFQGGIEYSALPGKVSNAYTVLKPKNGIEPLFFKWVLKSAGYIQELNSSTNQLRDGQSIKFADFASIDLPLPPLEEQRRIADFLDDQVGRIDQVIELRKEQLKSFNEAFDAELRETVLGSGTQDLGWASGIADDREFKPIGSLLRIRGEKNDPVQFEQILSLTAARGVIKYEDKGDIGNKASEDISRYNIVRAGDIVLNSMNVILGSVGQSSYDGALSPVYYVMCLKLPDQVSMEFLSFHFRIREFQRQLIRLGYGILEHRMRIPWINLKTELLAIPALETQKRIVHELLQLDLTRKRSLERLGVSIKLLQERKRSLITASVTGQLDVTTAKPVNIGVN